MLASVLRSKTLKLSKSVHSAGRYARQLHCSSFAMSKTSLFIEKVSEPYTVTTYARPELIIERGEGSYLYDYEGREYIDFMSGIAVTCLGHSNPDVTAIITKQALKLMHSSNLYYNRPAGDLAIKLVESTKASGGMAEALRVFLCNSGTEANEAALKFARKYGKSQNPDKFEIITFNNSFHGRTMGALSVTPNPKYQAPFAPLVQGVKVADVGNIDSVKSIISKEKTCAVIIEPIQGEGGVNPVDPEFLIALKQLCVENDVILIFDEIQCGLGRSGKLWAHGYLPAEAHPDILTMAKALGNGFPIGAVLVSEKVEKALSVGDHGTTYGGNPLGSAIGCHVVDQVSSPTFLSSVNEKSEKFLTRFEEIAKKYPTKVAAVKGKGLLIGLQMVNEVDAGAVVNIARDNGLLVITAGMNVVRVVPALNIPDEAIERGLDILEEAIGAVAFK